MKFWKLINYFSSYSPVSTENCTNRAITREIVNQFSKFQFWPLDTCCRKGYTKFQLNKPRNKGTGQVLLRRIKFDMLKISKFDSRRLESPCFNGHNSGYIWLFGKNSSHTPRSMFEEIICWVTSSLVEYYRARTLISKLYQIC